MATIKDLAEAHAPIDKNEPWDKIQKQIAKQTSFEAGMLAAITELESVLDSDHPEDKRPWLLKGNTLYKLLKSKINELKDYGN